MHVALNPYGKGATQTAHNFAWGNFVPARRAMPSPPRALIGPPPPPPARRTSCRGREGPSPTGPAHPQPCLASRRPCIGLARGHLEKDRQPTPASLHATCSPPTQTQPSSSKPPLASLCCPYTSPSFSVVPVLTRLDTPRHGRPRRHSLVTTVVPRDGPSTPIPTPLATTPPPP